MAKTSQPQAQIKAKPVPRTLKQARAATSIGTKSARVTALLQHPKGASIAEIMTVTGWQSHSVRGFMSGTLVKQHGLKLQSEKTNGQRRYRVIAVETAP